MSIAVKTYTPPTREEKLAARNAKWARGNLHYMKNVYPALMASKAEAIANADKYRERAKAYDSNGKWWTTPLVGIIAAFVSQEQAVLKYHSKMERADAGQYLDASTLSVEMRAYIEMMDRRERIEAAKKGGE